LHYSLDLTCAPTALRASEIVSLRWSDILWSDEQIRVSRRWAKGQDGATKTAASNGYAPMDPILAQYLQEWRAQSLFEIRRFCLSIADQGWKGSHQGVAFRAEPSAAGRN
jgi:integrase